MFAGHFGLAAGVRAKAPEVPLWALLAGSQLLDIVFIPMVMRGAESMDDKTHGSGYGELIIHADYTHSLVAALLLSVLAGLLAWRLWGKRASRIMASVVFSHWVLDLVVHRGDMPLLPGNWGDLPLLGLGAWRWPWLSAAMELVLIVVGLLLYTGFKLKDTQGAKRKKGIASVVVLGFVLVFMLASDVTGIF
ncbi:metal-dependent hydrolase [Paenibacillus lignilyticus]|uniref:Metal-dependent hydrolase n=1 Tax=Paenibacillus lignilyticus TaxID=1172615 RepID=A0ABS5CAW1_9BACL|nr:metal-dependent hydrolase [Paenibacillus lignilyticus]MBP3962955.1 metal-dependent hydrolase [Paenibacillus lignilyticus]